MRDRGEILPSSVKLLCSFYTHASKPRIFRSPPHEGKTRHAWSGQQAGSESSRLGCRDNCPLKWTFNVLCKREQPWMRVWVRLAHEQSVVWQISNLSGAVEKGKTIWIWVWELGCCCFGVDSLSLTESTGTAALFPGFIKSGFCKDFWLERYCYSCF